MTKAIHGISEGGSHLVGIGNLRVFIVQEDGHWYAQGLEIDYLAQGDSIKDAKEAFEKGLAATIHENISAHGTIEPMLNSAPNGIWKEVLDPNVSEHLYSQFSLHRIESLPFQGIQYLQQIEPAA